MMPTIRDKRRIYSSQDVCRSPGIATPDGASTGTIRAAYQFIEQTWRRKEGGSECVAGDGGSRETARSVAARRKRQFRLAQVLFSDSQSVIVCFDNPCVSCIAATKRPGHLAKTHSKILMV